MAWLSLLLFLSVLTGAVADVGVHRQRQGDDEKQTEQQQRQRNLQQRSNIWNIPEQRAARSGDESSSGRRRRTSWLLRDKVKAVKIIPPEYRDNNNGTTAVDGNGPPNVLFLVSDQLRYDCLRFVQDRMALYDGKLKVNTPNIDRLAAKVLYAMCCTLRPARESPDSYFFAFRFSCLFFHTL